MFLSIVDGAAKDFKANRIVAETTGYHTSNQLFLVLGAPLSYLLALKAFADFEIDSLSSVMVVEIGIRILVQIQKDLAFGIPLTTQKYMKF